jgi:2-keto-4-pentenoate hydratase/2-oxohepta-3-ene-1,7-dioic acid hydratase in catechol pathway
VRILRFIDDNGNVCLGTQRHGDTAIEVIERTGGYEITHEKKTIKKILPPVSPSAIYCIGLNYKGHAEETNMAVPEYPVLFMKNPASVIGHNDNIVIPESCRKKPQVDYEAELAVVISRPAKNIRADNALDYVKGYTVGNDISARWWQAHAGGGQWARGKSFDCFCPLGPELVTCEDIPDPGNLEISLTLNGNIMQQSNTAHMMFSVSRIIAYLSEDTTLPANSVILTGTPQGVGFARTPPVYLKPGDLLETTIEKIGTLTNRVT